MRPENLFRSGDAGDLAEKIDWWIDRPAERAAFGARYAGYADTMRVEDSVRMAESMFECAILEHASLPAAKRPRELVLDKDYPFIPRSIAERGASALFVKLATPFLYATLKWFFGLRVRGRRNLRAIRGGAVTVSNHVHNLDCAMVALAQFPKRVFFTAQKANFEKPIVGFLVRSLGGVPIPESISFLGDFMDALFEAVEKGKRIHFYPEGSLVEYCRELRPFQRGAFHLAVAKDVPVIPLVITYREPGGLFRLFRRLPLFNIEIGRPIRPDRALAPRAATEDLLARTHAAMLAMAGETTSVREDLSA
jgi:1-acyl-sn-glycerol-3-phosphate acyltransferase